MKVSDPLEDCMHLILMPNHWNDTNDMSDKLITRVLLHSTVAAISLPTLILKISCILDPKPIQLKCYIKCTCTGYVLL